jgi:hypothetical protein
MGEQRANSEGKNESDESARTFAQVKEGLDGIGDAVQRKFELSPRADEQSE